MEILNLSLPATNKFATDYIAQTKEIQRFFHYRYNDSSDYKARLGELKDRTFLREELAKHIEQYMAKFPSSKKVGQSLEKLKQENSAVVIGGQQAGILTGPLYTIHKIISIITLAKQKEEELEVPIVPVFWIAGEDHDYQEVNHVYVEKDNKMEKVIYPEKVLEKKMVSNIQLNKQTCLEWVKEIIETYGETEYTKELIQVLSEAVDSSETFVDFFAYTIMLLFKDSGLLLVDSGDKNLRTLEKEIFKKQINSFDEITKAVKQQQAELESNGFPNAIEISESAANLFYYDEKHKERILLDFHQEKGVFAGKECFLQFSFDQVLAIAEESPEKLSNNVVTRPLTQEMLFPTLAFIAGPGEIAYWAELKQAFEWFGMKMPPIVPRLNITLLDRFIEADIKELELDLQETLTFGIEKNKQEFLKSLKSKNSEELFLKIKQDLLKNYRQLEGQIELEDTGLIPLFKKNESLLIKQIEFMESKLESSNQMKHKTVISKYEKIGNALRPGNSPQERIWNGLYYLNLYGLEFVSNLLECPFEFDGTHKVIKI